MNKTEYNVNIIKCIVFNLASVNFIYYFFTNVPLTKEIVIISLKFHYVFKPFG